jgi:hypothetical protein
MNCGKAKQPALVAIASILVTSVLGTNQAAPQQSRMYLVLREKLRCVFENLEQYKHLSKEPVAIFLDFCPRTELTPQEIAKLTVAELPQVSSRQTQGPTRALVFSKAELN